MVDILGLFGATFVLLWLAVILSIFVLAAAMIGWFIFWISMIMDILKREFLKKDDKIMWVVLVVFVAFIGALLYYFEIKSKDKVVNEKALLISGLFFPGLGAIISGEKKKGITQMALFIVCIPLIFLVVGAPIFLSVWIWSLVSSLSLFKKLSRKA